MNTGKLERWTKRKLIRMLAFDERRELRQLRADGLLDLPATDAGRLHEVHRVLRAAGRFISTLGIGEERKSWPGRYKVDDIYGSRDVPFWVALLQNLGFLVELDPHGQGQYNDGERLHRACIDRRSRIRGFATYRIVAEKRP